MILFAITGAVTFLIIHKKSGNGKCMGKGRDDNYEDNEEEIEAEGLVDG